MRTPGGRCLFLALYCVWQSMDPTVGEDLADEDSIRSRLCTAYLSLVSELTGTDNMLQFECCRKKILRWQSPSVPTIFDESTYEERESGTSYHACIALSFLFALEFIRSASKSPLKDSLLDA